MAKKKINLELVEEICKAYGTELDLIMADAKIKYPAMKIPESILPYPKNLIRHALELWEKYAKKNHDKETAKVIHYTRATLECFVPDADAFKANNAKFDEKEILESIFLIDDEE